MTGALHRRHRRGSGSGGPTTSRWPPSTIGPIVDLIAALVERGHAYAAERRRLLPRAHAARLRRALAPRRRRDGPGRGDRGRATEGGPARLRALEGAEAGRGHLVGLARGAAAGRAGTSSARRWPRSCSASSSTSTAAASTSCSRTTRTRRRRRGRRAASRSPGCGCTTACSKPRQARRWRSRSATSRRLADVLDDVGGDRAGPVLQPAATTGSRWRSRDERLEAAAGGARRIRDAGAAARPPATVAARRSRRTGRRSSTRSRTTSTRPRRSRRCTSGSARPTSSQDARGRRATCARCSTCWASRRCSTPRGRRPREAVALASEREAARAASDWARGRPAARRAARDGLGGARRPARTGARHGVLSRARRDTARDGVLRRSSTAATRCARRRGRRRVHRIWATHRRGMAAARRRRPPRRSSAAAARDAPPGRLRRGRSVPVRRRRRAARGARSGDRRARRGDRPAEPRRDLPDGRGVGGDRGRDPRAAVGGGDRGGLQGVCGGGRAPADGAGPQPRRLPRRRQGGRLLVSTAPPRARATPYTAPGLVRRAWSWCSERRGRGCGHASRTPATTSSRCRSAAASRRSTSAPPRRCSCTRSCSTGLTRPHKRATLPLA